MRNLLNRLEERLSMEELIKASDERWNKKQRLIRAICDKIEPSNKRQAGIYNTISFTGREAEAREMGIDKSRIKSFFPLQNFTYEKLEMLLGMLNKTNRM